jgi:hypothetical protein
MEKHRNMKKIKKHDMLKGQQYNSKTKYSEEEENPKNSKV